MPKPKAPSWLTSAFAEGVTELAVADRPRVGPAYLGATGRCWLAQHDSHRRPCEGVLERFHFLNRQRVENALAALMPRVVIDPVSGWALDYDAADLILLAAWDPRNGEVGCTGHHRRYDGHACSPRAPRIEVPVLALPIRTVDFIFDWGLEGPAEDRFPGFNAALCDDRDAG